LAGEGVDGYLGFLAELDVDDVGLIDLDLGGDDGHVGEGHEGGTFGVLNAEDDCFPFADGDVGYEAIKGSDAAGEAEGVIVATEGGDALGDLAASGSGLGFGLKDGSLALGEGGDVDVEEGLLGVEVLLGDELVVVEGLGALVVELLLFEVGRSFVDVSFGGLLGGDKGIDVGARGVDGGALGGNGAGGLLAFDGGEELAGLGVIAFFDVEVRDSTEGGGADVDVGLGLDLSCAADRGDEIFANGFGGGDRGNV
jgi:hypothetical protein